MMLIQPIGVIYLNRLTIIGITLELQRVWTYGIEAEFNECLPGWNVFTDYPIVVYGSIRSTQKFKRLPLGNTKYKVRCRFHGTGMR